MHGLLKWSSFLHTLRTLGMMIKWRSFYDEIKKKLFTMSNDIVEKALQKMLVLFPFNGKKNSLKSRPLLRQWNIVIFLNLDQNTKDSLSIRSLILLTLCNKKSEFSSLTNKEIMISLKIKKWPLYYHMSCGWLLFCWDAEMHCYESNVQ